MRVVLLRHVSLSLNWRLLQPRRLLSPAFILLIPFCRWPSDQQLFVWLAWLCVWDVGMLVFFRLPYICFASRIKHIIVINNYWSLQCVSHDSLGGSTVSTFTRLGHPWHNAVYGNSVSWHRAVKWQTKDRLSWCLSLLRHLMCFISGLFAFEWLSLSVIMLH